MGGDLGILWRAIRRPMLAWWKRVGVWLLAAILGCYAAETLALAGPLGRLSVGAFSSISWSALAQIVDGVALLWAATVCIRLLTRVYEHHAAPEPPGFLRASFLLCYLQALVLRAVTMCARVVRTGLIRT